MVKAILFDVFGTTVDWRSSIIAELENFGDEHGLEEDWPIMADRWRAGFRELQGRIARVARETGLRWTRSTARSWMGCFTI